MDSFASLRDEMLEMIARIKIPKYQVLSTRRRGDGQIQLEEFNQQALYDKEDVHPSQFFDQLKRFQEIKIKSKDSSSYVELCLPGKIIQLFRTLGLSNPSSSTCLPCFGDSEPGESTDQIPYTARWAERSDFRRIILSSHFLSDHETDNVKIQLHELAISFCLKEPYSSVLLGDEMCGV
jgi:hypothetical protein